MAAVALEPVAIMREPFAHAPGYVDDACAAARWFRAYHRARSREIPLQDHIARMAEHKAGQVYANYIWRSL
jgi:hypothetical protein